VSDYITPASLGRKPSVALTVNGVEISAIVSATVGQNNHLAADTFSVVVGLDELSSGISIPQWAQADVISLSLVMTQDAGGLTEVVSGNVDEVAINLASATLTLSGRDYSALFIEVLTAEKFLNLTSSQVVEVLAARQGLNSRVTETSVLIGKYYDIDHAIVTNEITEWALLCNLAQHEGFDIFVTGRTLYFQPAVTATSGNVYGIFCASVGGKISSNVTRLVLKRKQTLATDIVVKVISWNHEHKMAITSVRRAQKVSQSANSLSAPSCNYVFREAGLSQSQADAVATARLNELAQHERHIEFDMPADFSLTPRSLIRLSGTGSGFDQLYFISQIHINSSLKGGLTMRVSAKNASPYQVANS
jgi:phage protein D